MEAVNDLQPHAILDHRAPNRDQHETDGESQLEHYPANGPLRGADQLHAEHEARYVGARRPEDPVQESEREEQVVIVDERDRHAENELGDRRHVEYYLSTVLVREAAQRHRADEHAEHVRGLGQRAHPSSRADEVPLHAAGRLEVLGVVRPRVAFLHLVARVQVVTSVHCTGENLHSRVRVDCREIVRIGDEGVGLGHVALVGWHSGHSQQREHVQAGRQRAQNVQRELPELVFTEFPEMAHQFLQVVVHARHSSILEKFFLPRYSCTWVSDFFQIDSSLMDMIVSFLILITYYFFLPIVNVVRKVHAL